jgi:hypothetical protein
MKRDRLSLPDLPVVEWNQKKRAEKKAQEGN